MATNHFSAIKKYLSLLYVAIVASLSLMVTSCGESPVDKSLAIVDDAIEKIEQTNDVYELVGIANSLQSDLNALDAANKDYKPTEEEARKIQNKLNELQRVYLNRVMELSYGDSPQGEAAKDLLDKMLPQ